VIAQIVISSKIKSDQIQCILSCGLVILTKIHCGTASITERRTRIQQYGNDPCGRPIS
jgi:hypothetical protein